MTDTSINEIELRPSKKTLTHIVSWFSTRVLRLFNGEKILLVIMVWRQLAIQMGETEVGPFSSVQSLSRVLLFGTPWIAAHQASLSITNSRSSPRPTSIESVMPSNHLILCCPPLLLPPIPPSIRVFSNESTLCMRWPKYWSFSLIIIPSKKSQGWSPSEWTGWISESKGLWRVFSTPQFKSINFLALSFLHSPTLTSIHDYWENHSLDETELCWQNNVSAFECAI